MSEFDRESMLEMFTFEMNQLLESLEQNIITSQTGYTMDKINEIFRVMHTIKGSSAMMMFNNIAEGAHAIEDLFYYLREENPPNVDESTITDLVLESLDFVKEEIRKIESGLPADGDAKSTIEKLKVYLVALKSKNSGETPEATKPKNENKSILLEKITDIFDFVKNNDASYGEYNFFEAKISFDDGCEMENVRAFTIVHSLKDFATEIISRPPDLIDEASIEIIRQNGLTLYILTLSPYEKINEMLNSALFLKELTLVDRTGEEQSHELDQKEEVTQVPIEVAQSNDPHAKRNVVQQVISVNVSKLDQLLKLMGELVISEAMVTQNPELASVTLDSFHKEARQLRKIIKDIQDNVMSMRMVPLSTTFFKMHRIVRDMTKQLGKEIKLDVFGEETEVDKNITEHISDPLMHIIRNSADHGIELPEDRKKAGKPIQGTITLEAKNSGSDVLITIRDDGGGLNRNRILKKAIANGMLRKPESDYTDKEVFQFVFMPGFSTNEAVTSYSGRGVGMDVVVKNLEKVGGTVLVDSIAGEGSIFTLKIPLTLAIIEGMMIKMGGEKYTIPIMSIKDSFKPEKQNIFLDPSGNEMITVRGESYNIVKLYQIFNVDNALTNFEEGIMIMLENGDDTICLFVDELVGEQQVVVKTLPKYINKVSGVSGCTLLGNGDISLILDVAGFFEN